MRLARRLLKSKPLEPYYDHEDFPGPGVETDDELLGAAKQRGTTTFHPSGTCRMAPASDPMAVVDDQLRVHGLEGLRVIDASVMPTMLSANLNAATHDDRREGLRPAARPHRARADRAGGGVISIAERNERDVQPLAHRAPPPKCRRGRSSQIEIHAATAQGVNASDSCSSRCLRD